MSVGLVKPGSTPVELRPDTRRVHKLTWPGGVLPGLRAIVDGAGSGNASTPAASQAIRATVQDASGAIVATTDEVAVPASYGNGDIERGLEGFAAVGSGVSLSLNTATPHSGTQALRIVQTVANTGVSGAYLNVLPNTQYILTYWAKRELTSTTQVYPFAIEYTSAGAFVTQTQGTNTSLAQGVWNQYSMVVTTSSTTGRLWFSFRGSQAASNWSLDDIQVNGVGASFPVSLPISAAPLLPAGDYYLSLSAAGDSRLARVWGNGMAQPWVNLAPNPRLVPATSGALPSTVGFSGLAATLAMIPGGGVRATATSAALAGPYFAAAGSSVVPTKDVAVVPGRMYAVGGSITAMPSGTTVRAGLVYRDASGGNIAANQVAGNLITAPGVTFAAGVAPVGAVSVACTFYRAAGGSAAVGDVIDVTMIGVYEVQATAPFPGFIVGDDLGASWAGAPNASPSIGPRGLVNLSHTGNDYTISPWVLKAGTAKSIVTDPTNPMGPDAPILRLTDTANQGGGTSYAADPYLPSGQALKPNGRYTMASLVKANAGVFIQLPFATRPATQTLIASSYQPAAVKAATGDWEILWTTIQAPPNVTGLIDAPGTARAALGYIDVAAHMIYEGEKVPTLEMFFDGAQANASSFGTVHNSPSILWQAGAEVLDTYSDGPSSGLPQGGAKTMGTMNLAMGEMVAAAAMSATAESAAAGAGVLWFAATGAHTAESTASGSGVVQLRGPGADLLGESSAAGAGRLRLGGPAMPSSGNSDFAGAGTLSLRGSASMVAESSLDGAGRLRYALAGVLDGQSAFDGYGTAQLAGTGGALSAESSLEGAGSTILALVGSLAASGDLAGAGRLIYALVAQANGESAASGHGVLAINPGDLRSDGRSSLDGHGVLAFLGIAYGLAAASSLAGAGHLIFPPIDGGDIATGGRPGTAAVLGGRPGTAAVEGNPKTGVAAGTRS
jgi:hypothetical protein